MAGVWEPVSIFSAQNGDTRNLWEPQSQRTGKATDSFQRLSGGLGERNHRFLRL